MEIRALCYYDQAEARALLRENIPANLFLLGLLDGKAEEESISLYGLWRESEPAAGDESRKNRLKAVVGVSRGGLVVPWAPSLEDAHALGSFLRSERSVVMAVGPRDSCDAIWSEQRFRLPPRLFYDQRLYVCLHPSPGHAFLGQRLARPEDLPILEKLSSRMMLEDLGFDPGANDPELHRLQVERRIRRSCTWVVEHSGTILFKVDVGTWTPDGLTLGGTYVPPHWRGRGICTSAMRGVTRTLLTKVPLVSLHVNELNTRAVRAYEGAGYERVDAFRIVIAA